MTPQLPVDDVLPALLAALAARPNAVLLAPPGAGKTTRVPLALLAAPWRGDGRIVLLEPRRLAARAAARRMAATLGEQVGTRVGYRVRMERRVSAATRIEVVTEGVFTQMILDDSELSGVAAVIFDEFHERSLDADLGLALALDAQSAFRPDLRLLAMSATIDGAAVARLLGGAPVIASDGRMFPVETRHLPRAPGARIEEDVAAAVARALREEAGSVLAFLPGQAEIRRTAERLAGRLPADTELAPLYGALSPGEQDRAIAPAAPGRRKVVLATSIAETSLTIEGVRIVVDGGLARRPVYEPATALTRLETGRVSRAAADQRRGRAGRTETGVCYRLWAEAETASLRPHEPPEMLAADLAPLALALGRWGVTDPAVLRFLDPPPAAAWNEALTLLRSLDALDAAGRLTPEGEALSRLALPPRLAHMLRRAAAEGRGRVAADLAAVLAERGLGGSDPDLRERLRRFRTEPGARAEEARRLAARFAREAGVGDEGPGSVEETGAVLALAYPDRVAQARGQPGSFVLAGGRGASLDIGDPLAREPFLVVADIQGTAASGRILAAAPIARAEVEARFAERIETVDAVAFERATGTVRARRLTRLGRLVLGEQALSDPAPEAVRAALLAGIGELGLACLPFGGAAEGLRQRLAFLRRRLGPPWPDVSDEALQAGLADWLGPYLTGKRRLGDITGVELAAALRSLVPAGSSRTLERLAPAAWPAPTGRDVPIDYCEPDSPTVAIKVQELFGLDRHPAVLDGQAPLTLSLLSPAGRPVQVTRDLPGFWRGSWRAVRSDLRGRYPKHPWPENPLAAEPTMRAKPRG